MALDKKLSVLLKDANEPILSAKLTKTRAPLFDIFGPFPDEPLVEAMDRFLYYSGAQRAQKLLGLPTPMEECTSSTDCEIIAKCSKSRAKCKPNCPAPCNKSTKRSADGSFSKSPTCHCRAKPTKPHVDFVRPELPTLPNLSPIGLLGKRIKRSFSLCSLACRRWAQRKSPSDIGDKNDDAKWLCTRKVDHPTGCQIFEVFANVNMKTHPNSLTYKNRPLAIFIVTPTGEVVHFEPLRCH